MHGVQRRNGRGRSAPLPHLSILLSFPGPPYEKEFLVDNLLVRIHSLIETNLVDRPCAMGVGIPFFQTTTMTCLADADLARAAVFFFERSLSIKLSDTTVYEP